MVHKNSHPLFLKLKLLHLQIWICYTATKIGEYLHQTRVFENLVLKNVPSFSFSNFENFRGLPLPILKPRRCPRSRKPSKFENENENSRGLRSHLPPYWRNPCYDLCYKICLLANIFYNRIWNVIWNMTLNMNHYRNLKHILKHMLANRDYNRL